ncbi:MAG: hypothetical protein OQK95_13905 [Gammaproteobacteria bacterium]|nr:hypothetical protein [Gammaproteobacteria bacterium]
MFVTVFRNVLLFFILFSATVAIAEQCAGTTYYYNGKCGYEPSDPGYYINGLWISTPIFPGRTSKEEAVQACRSALEIWGPDYYTNTIYQGLATVALNGYQSEFVSHVVRRDNFFINGQWRTATMRFVYVNTGLQGTFPKENFKTGLTKCYGTRCESRFYWEDYTVIQGSIKEIHWSGCNSPFEEEKKYFIQLTADKPASGLSGNYVTKIYPGNYSLTQSNPRVHPTLALLNAKVVDEDGEIQKDVKLKIEIEPIEQTGGHLGTTNHSTRPKINRTYGRLRKVGDNLNLLGLEIEGSTGTTGLDFYYVAPEISGDYKLKITCVDKECFHEDPTTVYVGVDGLSSLGDRVIYKLIGKTEYHNDNHYVDSQTRDKLARLVQRYNRYRQNYKAEYPNIPVIHFNDASLIRGGTFDIKGTWKNKHELHRVGTDIDVRANGASGSIPNNLFNTFKTFVKNVGCVADLEFNTTITNAEGNTIIHPNRHFHLYCD